MKRRLHWRRRTAIFRPLDQSDRLKLAAVHLVCAAALLLQEKKREEEAGRSDGEVWLTINDAMPSLDLCCDYIADLLDTKKGVPMIKRTIYLIAAVKSRRIVGWHRKQSERDGMLTELNHNCPGQYLGGTLVAEDDGKLVSKTYTPADLVVPDAYRDELDRLCRGW